MNDFFKTEPENKPEAKPELPVVETGFAAIEINPDRRRKDTDLVVEPGADARALARLLRQDVGDFVQVAIANHIAHLTSRLAG